LKYTDDKLLEYLRKIDNPISNDVVLRLNNRWHYRVVRKFYTWELKNKLIMTEDEHKEDLENKGLYDDFQALIIQFKLSQFNTLKYIT